MKDELRQAIVDQARSVQSGNDVDARYSRAAATLTMLGGQAKRDGEHEQAREFMDAAQTFRTKLSFVRKQAVTEAEHNAFPNGRYGGAR